MRVPDILLLVIIGVFLSCSAGAQAPRARALDVTLGVGTAMRRGYTATVAPAGDAMLSIPLRERWLGAISFSAQAALDINDCTVPIGGGPCQAFQPFVLAWSALFGHEWRAHETLALRTLVGPSLVRELQYGTSNSTAMGGATARVDVVATLPVNVLFTIRATLAPALLQSARGTVAVGLGVGYARRRHTDDQH